MAEDFVTIFTCDDPHGISVPRSILEDAGIETKLVDELINQVNPLYANAVGGIKLQVLIKDYEAAILILQEGGFLSRGGASGPALAEKLADIWYNKKQMFIVVLAALVLFTAALIWLANKALLPSDKEMLVNGNWCIDQVIYNNAIYYPETIKMLKLSGSGYCEEQVSFQRSGIILLPGFQSREVNAWWKLTDKEVEIYNADSFDFVFNGNYQMKFEGHTLLLSSATTVIRCTSLKKADWWFQ